RGEGRPERSGFRSAAAVSRKSNLVISDLNQLAHPVNASTNITTQPALALLMLSPRQLLNDPLASVSQQHPDTAWQNDAPETPAVRRHHPARFPTAYAGTVFGHDGLSSYGERQNLRLTHRRPQNVQFLESALGRKTPKHGNAASDQQLPA